MLEHKVITVRHPINFEDLTIERKIDYTLTHNGNPVELKKSSVEDLVDHPTLKGWRIDKVETYNNFEGNVVYRGKASKPVQDKESDKRHEILFYIEKVF